jgi:hypothetical protein
LPISALTMGERAHAKLRSHGIEEWEPFEAFFNRWVLLRNRKHRAASHRLVGRTDSGRLLTLLVKETKDTGIWEVLNGWDSSKGERTLFERRAR